MLRSAGSKLSAAAIHGAADVALAASPVGFNGPLPDFALASSPAGFDFGPGPRLKRQNVILLSSSANLFAINS